MRKFTDSRTTPGRRNDVSPRNLCEQPRNAVFETRYRKFEDSDRNTVRELPDPRNLYERPAWRAGMRDKVWEQAKDTHGRVRDPISGKYMSKNQPWDMGHKPGYEFKKHQESARRRGISREQFIDEYNNPDHLRPELPESNRSHRGENKTGEYFGDSKMDRVEQAINTTNKMIEVASNVATAVNIAKRAAPVAAALFI